MTRRHFKVVTGLVFLLTAAGIGALILLPKDIFSPEIKEVHEARVVIPQAMSGGANPGEGRDGQNGEENTAAKVSFSGGESLISALTRDFDGDSADEQIIAFRNLQEIDTPVYITYVDFDPAAGIDKRVWTAPTAATRPGTLILYGEDLIGDGGICVLAAGMNGSGEQTLTVFRKNDFPPPSIEAWDGAGPPVIQDTQTEPFNKIAEFIIEGSIAVQERNYRNGDGQSLSIATYGRDYESSNLLDQVEVTYTYNRVNGLYEQSRVVKIPGFQIEQRRVRELLSGAPGQFEEFIDGLWRLNARNSKYHYVFFNTANREMIFYNNDSEEVFKWQDSNPTRYGLHIIGRNSSLTKLRRTVNIELQSLENIRLRVFQDVYLRSGPGTVWDGSYQRVNSLENTRTVQHTVSNFTGVYHGSEGSVSFLPNGSYELISGFGPDKHIERGKYVFFRMGTDELLELRPEEPQDGKNPIKLSRETFRVSRSEDEGAEVLSLTRVQMGTRGMQELHEAPIALTKRDSKN